MNDFEKQGFDPEIKKAINKEGFDENAAILIGTKEEMPQLEEKLEKEGMAENLGTYIKMHKEIVLPAERLNKYVENGGRKFNKGEWWWADTLTFRYVDKNGNIAEVKIDPLKVSSIKDLRAESLYNKIVEELSELFFNYTTGQTTEIRDIEIEVNLCRADIAKELKEKKKEEFDF